MKENPFLYAIKFFFCTLLKKTVFEEIKISGSFSSCVTFESWLL